MVIAIHDVHLDLKTTDRGKISNTASKETRRFFVKLPGNTDSIAITNRFDFAAVAVC